MAVRADTGNVSDQVGPLVMTAGPTTPKACQASFAKVWEGGGLTFTFRMFYYCCLPESPGGNAID